MAKAKPEAKKAIDDALTVKNNAIDARDDLTPEQKTALKNAAKAKADAAKDAIDKATTNADVDQAKTDGATAVANVTPVAKEPAKQAIAKALEDKNAEIDKRTDLTVEEKAKAKAEAKKLADAQLAEIAKQPDVADTPEAAQTAQTAVDAAKKTGVDEVTAVNPTAVTKPEAKKAIDEKLTKQLEDIANTPDATDEEKKVAADAAKAAAEKAKEEIDKAETDAAVEAKKDEAVGKDGAKGTIDKLPLVEDKPNARKAIEDEANAKKQAIDARRDLTPEAKAVLKAKVDKVAEKAKEGIDAVTSKTDVDVIKEADKAAIKAIGEINRPIDKVLVKDPSALTVEEKAKILEEVKKVNPTAKEVKYDDNGNIEVTTEAGDKGIIVPTKLVKTEDQLDNGKGGNDINKPLDKVIVKDPSKLTAEEKAKIIAEVEAVNPDAIVTIDDNGTVSVSTPEGKTAAISASDLVRTKEDTTNPDAGNSKIVKPADKLVGNPTNSDDRAKVEEKLKELNPEAKSVIFDENGNATVTLKDGTTATIPEADLFKSEAYLTEPKAGNDVVKPADKTVVANPDALTPEEKKAIEDKVKAVNPGATVVVDAKGNTLVTTPEGKTAVIPATDLTKSAEDAAKPNAGDDIVKPADKTVVANPEKLTDAEKKAIEDKVKAVNPGATVAVDDKGNATVTLENGKTAVIPEADLTKTAADAAKPNAGNDIVKPADKTVVANPDALTPEEKKAIEDKVKAVNPGATVVVDDKGNATVTTPEGKTAVIPATDLTKSAADAAKPKAGNDIVKPADKTVVANPDKLTDAEKKAIEDKVKAVNPGATVVVDDKGNATVTTPDGKTAVIPATDLTKSAADAAKPKAGNDIVKPADKTVVANPEQLTDKEKEAVKKAVETVNPGSTVVVDDKGNATVTTKDGKTAVIPATDLTKSAEDAAKPNAGNDVVKPADKTVVANPDSLTQDEKDAIAAKVRAVNPGATVVVDDKGNATVTTPEGKTAVIPAADLTKNADAEKAPKAGNDIVKPASKVLVKDPESLTKDEKDAIAAKVAAVNPGSTVVVDDKGNATVTTPEGKTAVIPASDLTKSEKDVNDGKAKDNALTPAAKTKVADPNSLTDSEKKAIEDKVKAANPGAEVFVDDKGNATVVKDGNVSVIPSTDLVKVEDDAKKDNGGNDANTPAAKTVVKDPANLTDEEKAKVKKAVEAVNPGSTVVVDDKGNATVTKADGTVLNIPSTDLVIPADNLADEAKNAKVKTPAIRTLVGDKDNLTADEKEAVKKAIEAVNPGSTVVVDDKGNATVTLPDGSTATIAKEQLVKDKEDAKAKNGGDNLEFDFSKVTVTDLKNITPEEKAKFQFMILGAITGVEEFDISTLEKSTDDKGNTVYASKDGKVKITIDKDGNATIEKDGKKELAVTIDKEGNVTIVTKEGQVLAIPRDDAFRQKETPKLPEKVGVVNKTNLTDEEKAAVKEALIKANPKLKDANITISATGESTIVYPDGQKVVIPADKLVEEKLSDSNGNTELDINLPEKVAVGDVNNLTDAEKAAVKEALIKANPKLKDAKITISAKGEATIVYPDGKVVVIPAANLVVAKGANNNAGAGDKATDADSKDVNVKAAANANQEETTNARTVAKELPNTGTKESTLAMVAAAASALLGLGLAGRRRKEDEEA